MWYPAEARTETRPAAAPSLPAKEKAGSAGSSRQQDRRHRAGGGDREVWAPGGRSRRFLGRAGQPGCLQPLQHLLCVRDQLLGEETVGPSQLHKQVSVTSPAFEELMAALSKFRHGPTGSRRHRNGTEHQASPAGASVRFSGPRPTHQAGGEALLDLPDQRLDAAGHQLAQGVLCGQGGS